MFSKFDYVELQLTLRELEKSCQTKSSLNRMVMDHIVIFK